jgi:predicted N-acetyltransferase YhbS
MGNHPCQDGQELSKAINKREMKLEIRQETAADFAAVYKLNKAAFEQDLEAKLVEDLRTGEAFIPELSLVAAIDGKIVGHILFTKITIRDETGHQADSLALAPMAVMPGFQNKGIGGQLINKGLQKARELGHKSVIVVGHENYYPKFGFVPAQTWNIKAPFEVPAHAFMGIELVAGGLKNVEGTVVYPKEFDAA